MPAALRALTLAFAMMALPLATATAQQAGPTAASAHAGYRASTSDDPGYKDAVVNAAKNTEGIDIGLMVGGGAALIIGIIIGSVGGIVLALIGGAVAIVGLILFLQH
jgi:hypothetical protein